MKIYNLIRQDKQDGDVSCESYTTEAEAIDADKRTRYYENSWIIESEIELDEEE